MQPYIRAKSVLSTRKRSHIPGNEYVDRKTAQQGGRALLGNPRYNEHLRLGWRAQRVEVATSSDYLRWTQIERDRIGSYLQSWRCRSLGSTCRYVAQAGRGQESTAIRAAAKLRRGRDLLDRQPGRTHDVRLLEKSGP